MRCVHTHTPLSDAGVPWQQAAARHTDGAHPTFIAFFLFFFCFFAFVFGFAVFLSFFPFFFFGTCSSWCAMAMFRYCCDRTKRTACTATSSSCQRTTGTLTRTARCIRRQRHPRSRPSPTPDIAAGRSLARNGRSIPCAWRRFCRASSQRTLREP